MTTCEITPTTSATVRRDWREAVRTALLLIGVLLATPLLMLVFGACATMGEPQER